MANYLKKYGAGMSSPDHEGLEKLKPLTPRSERSRASYGSLLMSAQMVSGLCSRDRKCVRKDGHDGACWPKEN